MAVAVLVRRVVVEVVVRVGTLKQLQAYETAAGST